MHTPVQRPAKQHKSKKRRGGNRGKFSPTVLHSALSVVELIISGCYSGRPAGRGGVEEEEATIEGGRERKDGKGLVGDKEAVERCGALCTQLDFYLEEWLLK